MMWWNAFKKMILKNDPAAFEPQKSSLFSPSFLPLSLFSSPFLFFSSSFLLLLLPFSLFLRFFARRGG